MYRASVVAPRIKEDPGWAALATSERKSLVDDEPVNLSKETVVSLIDDEPLSLGRWHRFLATLPSDEPVGLIRENRYTYSRVYTAPGDAEKRVLWRLPPIGVKSQEEKGLEAAELRQALEDLAARNTSGESHSCTLRVEPRMNLS